MKVLFLYLLFLISTLEAAQFPVLYQGRYRPFDTACKCYRISEDEAWQRHFTNDWQDAFIALPTKQGTKQKWVSLKLLLENSTNFTLYSDASYQKIRSSYLNKDTESLAEELLNAYSSLKNPVVTYARLKAESFYYAFPFSTLILFCYFCAGIFCLFRRLEKLGLIALTIGFFLHFCLLLLRCFILKRPPVANMAESLIYVPWIIVSIGILLHIFYKNPLLISASSFGGFFFLWLLDIFSLSQDLENVQPVLNSQFWLIIHVLLVVGSYGIFIVSGILSHLYLVFFIFKKNLGASLSSPIIKTLHGGLSLLIPGTILGGIWAAQSWGRFWDWDPKESWAFISAGVYLLTVHAYRYKKINEFGLAIGSIIGLISISFTWYGVNYILGTGLHSYGFGNGGEIYYYIYLLLELLYILLALLFKWLRKNSFSKSELPKN